MTNLTAAEVLFVQEHLRASIAGIRFLNHVANETDDIQFKQLCQQFAQAKQSELQQMMPVLGGAGAGTATGGTQMQTPGAIARPIQ